MDEVDRLEVNGETLVTVRGAAELLGLSIVRCNQLARNLWESAKLGRIRVMLLEEVLTYHGNGACLPLPEFHPRPDRRPLLPRSEILKTRPGVLTTLAHLAREHDLSPTDFYRFVSAGLPAVRLGSDTLTYLDEWEEFCRREWERPRLKRPRKLPRPKDAKVPPLIPYPWTGIRQATWEKGRFEGWTQLYARGLQQGEPPSVNRPLSHRVCKKLGIPWQGDSAERGKGARRAQAKS